MGKRKDVTNEKKIAIETLLKTGIYSHREIARREHVSRQVVDKVAKLIAENLPSTSSGRTHCGRHRKTTVREDRVIVKRSLEHRRQPLRAVLRTLEADDIKISRRTLQSRLYEAKIYSRRPAKKPRLTERMRKMRLQWAIQHKNLTVEDWKQVCVFILFKFIKFHTF